MDDLSKVLHGRLHVVAIAGNKHALVHNYIGWGIAILICSAGAICFTPVCCCMLSVFYRTSLDCTSLLLSVSSLYLENSLDCAVRYYS